MKLSALHNTEKAVSATPVFKTEGCQTISLQIRQGGLLKEHHTPTPATLFCILGEVLYQDENGQEITLTAGTYHPIQPMVKHWVKGIRESQLILVK